MMYGVIFFLLLLVDTWPGVQPKPFIAESSVAQFMLKKDTSHLTTSIR